MEKVIFIDSHPSRARQNGAGSSFVASPSALPARPGFQNCTVNSGSSPDSLAEWETALGNLLIKQGTLTRADLANVSGMRAELPENKTLSTLLVNLGLVASADMATALSQALNLPLVTSEELQYLASEASVSKRFLIDRSLFIFSETDTEIGLAMSDPADDFSEAAIAMASGKTVRRYVAQQADIAKALSINFGQNAEHEGDADLLPATSELDVEQLKDMASEAPVIRLVNLLLQCATDAGASDIHIEPFDHVVKVRCRVDGVLQLLEPLPINLSAAVISRIKIMAGLDIAERRVPQDGRMKLRQSGKTLDVRVSTVPTMYGESVVMRLLNRDAVSLELDALGLGVNVGRKIRQSLKHAHGMILVTGPTGSGKTTTLYTALNILNTQERKIITAEDPVEYQIEGVNQIQVQPSIGLSFANVLRSIVRQDPDVILVGEMRDLETAKICVQSALTGHLVLSTLHTNSAASGITRLLEMGVEDYLLSSTINAIVSQRLIRLLCTHCREAYQPTSHLLQRIECGIEGLGDSARLYRATGCKHCKGTGYAGRSAIAEILIVNDQVRECIVQQRDAKSIDAVAVANGMTTLWQQGCSRVLRGDTSIEEISRVVQEG